MANQEQLEILRQGVQVWNKWRKENLSAEIDLSGTSFIDTFLGEPNLSGANFSDADLSDTNLRDAVLRDVNLRGVNLCRANLRRANLNSANLNGANLMGANLRGTNFSYANLIDAEFFEAILEATIFSEIDLREIHGLEKIKHLSSSTIGADTIKLSEGNIPEVFLRGCGLSDWEIESAKLYKLGLSNNEINNIIYRIFDLRANQSVQISPLFISYSHRDTLFVEKLEPHLTKFGIRFWRDVHNATAGRLETQIDQAMRQNPTVLLILSKGSTSSDWVEHEVRLARELEKEIGRDVLCPIALDASWMSAKWPARLMEQIKEYNILDFSKWEDDKSFKQVFIKMVNGLDMFYKADSTK